jgi:hypothetical protein
MARKPYTPGDVPYNPETAAEETGTPYVGPGESGTGPGTPGYVGTPGTPAYAGSRNVNAPSVTLTIDELNALIDKRVNAATGIRGRFDDGVEAPLPTHRKDHGHGAMLSALLAIAAHAGLYHTEGGHSPFDLAIDMLTGHRVPNVDPNDLPGVTGFNDPNYRASDPNYRSRG